MTYFCKSAQPNGHVPLSSSHVLMEEGGERGEAVQVREIVNVNIKASFVDKHNLLFIDVEKATAIGMSDTASIKNAFLPFYYSLILLTDIIMLDNNH